MSLFCLLTETTLKMKGVKEWSLVYSTQVRNNVKKTYTNNHHLMPNLFIFITLVSADLAVSSLCQQ